MAKAKSLTDQYVSQAIISPTESVAGTLTFEKLETGLSIYDKIGWVLSRVEYRVSVATLNQFNTTGDTLTVALTMSNALASLSETDPAIYTYRKWQRLDFGTAATGSIFTSLFVDDYSTLPGGGLLILPSPLYGGIIGYGLGGAASVFIRLFFQAIELGDQDYFNLVQARQLLIST